MKERKRKAPTLPPEQTLYNNESSHFIPEWDHNKQENYTHHNLNWFNGLRGICTKLDDICVRINPYFPHAMNQWENDTSDIATINRFLSEISTYNEANPRPIYYRQPHIMNDPYNPMLSIDNQMQNSTWLYTQPIPTQNISTQPIQYTSMNPTKQDTPVYSSNIPYKPDVKDYEYLLDFPHKNQPDLNSPEDLKMDIPGVYWTKNSWIASWYQNKKRHYKSFSAKTHGFYKAKFWAIKVRLMEESKPSVNVKSKFKLL